jgi:hypothetical protein
VRPGSLDIAFESKILALLKERKTVFGSKALVTCEEAEEQTLREESEKREELDVKEPSLERVRERCRQAARRLAARGEVVVTQQGKEVDPSFAKGTMELKLPAK